MKRVYLIAASLVLLFFLCGIGSALAQGLPFITKWECKKGKEVPIPIVGTYKMLITDANGQEKVNETVTVADANHPYIFKPTEDGIYTVTAGPEGVECIQTENRNCRELIEVVQFGTVEWTSMEDAFQRCLNMTFAENIDIPNLSKVTNMEDMFFECKAFNSSLKGWDVSHVTSMCGMFYNCFSFNQSLEGWDVSHVTDMRQMFYNCTSFNQSLTGWDVSNVTKMGQMFFGCTSFNQSLEGWDVSHVTNMSQMFYGCTSFNQSLGAWKIKTAVGSLGETAMSVENYSKSLVGWAEWAKQADIRDIKFKNNVQGLVYNAKGKAARAELIKRGWTFEGDIEQTFEVTLVQPEHGTLAIEGYTTEMLKKVSDETELTITATTTEEGYELKELQVNGKKLEGKKFKVTANTTVTALFGKKTFPVTVSVKDGKGGSVKLEGAANLDAVEYGTTLTVVATPDEANGYKLKAVTVNGTPLAEGVMTFVVKEAKTVVAEFELKTFSVTKELKGVTTGEITITGATNLDAVEYGTELTVEATTTEEGYELKELQVNGTKLEGRTFKVTGATTVTALFGKKTFPITATVKDNKGGTVSLTGAANLDAVEYGTTLTVVATPDEANGYRLKAVTVNGTPLAEGVMTFVVKEAKTVEVEFALKTFPVTKELKGVTKGEITITGATNLDAVEYGTELTVEATTTEAGYELKELQVNGTKLEGKTFKVTAKTTVTAVFGLKTFAVTASVKDGKGGEVKLEGAANLDAVEYGTTLTVVATPDEANGYKLKAVTVNGTPLAEGVMLFVVKEAKTVEVEFALKTFPVTKELKGVTTGEITITGATNLEAVEYGTELTVEGATTSEEGYELKELQVNGTKLEGKTFKVTGEAKVTAVFGLKTFPVTKELKGVTKGEITITGATNLDAVEYGTELTVEATTTEEGYELKEIQVNGTKLEGKTFKVTGEAKVTAVFGLKTFSVTKELKGVTKGEITITGATNLDAVEYGTELTVEATTTEEGYELKELQVNGTKLEGKTFKVTGEAKVTAVFEKKNNPPTPPTPPTPQPNPTPDPKPETFEVTLTQPEHGTLEIEGYTTETLKAVAKGTELKVKATPKNEGGVTYDLKELKANGVDIKGTMKFTVTAKTTVTARFEKKQGGEDNKDKDKDPKNPNAVEDAVLASLSVAPNPFTAQLRILNPEGIVARYEFVNQMGVVLRAGEINGNQTLVDTEPLPAGLYFVRLTAQGGARKTLKVYRN